MFIAESFIRLGQRGFLGRRKETDRQSRAEIAPGWGYLVRREWRAAACRLIHSQYLAWPDPPYRGGYPRVYIYIGSGRNPLPRLRIPGISSVMHLSCQSYICCNPQGYRMCVVAPASIRTANYSGAHDLFVERRQCLPICTHLPPSRDLLLTLACINRIYTSVVHVHLMYQGPASTCTVRDRSISFY